MGDARRARLPRGQDIALSAAVLVVPLVFGLAFVVFAGLAISTDPFPCGIETTCTQQQEFALGLTTDVLLALLPLALYLATIVTVVVLAVRHRRCLPAAIIGLALMAASGIAAVVVWQVAKL